MLVLNEFAEEFDVKYSDMECDLTLKPYALLNFLQDIASKNAEELGFGYSNLYKNNLAWFLIKYHMEFENYPIGKYDLKIKTEPRGFNKLFAYRDFDITSNGEILGRVTSTWSIVDIDSRNLIPIAQVIENNPYMVVHQKRDDDMNYIKIPQLSNVDAEKSFEVRYNDLDVNGHANNGNYIIWAFETLNFDFRKNNKIKILDMMFKKEAVCGEVVTSQVEFLENNVTLHHLINPAGEDLCLIRCQWQNFLND